ncbi:MAG: metallophosphoesterase [Clostridia bacterium]|nr:metallophosphoesterase [Clostridia bacterium]
MVYVTSDLHGYPLDKFKALLDKADFGADDFCFVLGDVIDRGNESIKLLKWLMLQPNFQLIRGNHEDMMLSCSFLFDEITNKSIDSLTGLDMRFYSNWVSNGGDKTLEELSAIRNKEIKYILEYLEDTPLYETVSVSGRDFILTHSGLGSFSPDKKLSDYAEFDLLWTRPNFNQRYFDDIITVFGHTPTVYYGDEYKRRAIINKTWIDVDTGSSCGYDPMLLRLDDLKEFYVDD